MENSGILKLEELETNISIMKTTIKTPNNHFGLTFLVLLAALFGLLDAPHNQNSYEHQFQTKIRCSFCIGFFADVALAHDVPIHNTETMPMAEN